jgi:hypothetical protein
MTSTMPNTQVLCNETETPATTLQFFKSYCTQADIFYCPWMVPYCTEIFLHKGFKELSFGFVRVLPNGYPPGSTGKI